MSIPRPMLILVGVFWVASSAALAQTTNTILFDGTDAETGVTVPGATDFSLLGTTWTGGVVATESIPALYASGDFAYAISDAGGEVSFTDPVDSAEFFFVHSGASFVPSSRGGAPCVWVGTMRKLILFGGMLPITGDTLEYDTDTGAWRELTPELRGDVPAPRCHHSLVSDIANTNILMFGGFSFAGRFNDVWRFDPITERWVQLFPSGVVPARRCLHAATYVPSRHEMFVYGGVKAGGVASNDYFADTHVLDLANQEWVDTQTAGPGKLRGAIAFYSTTQDAVYLWGGKQVSHFPTTLWRFDVAARMWESVAVSGDVPLGREDPSFFWDDGAQRLTLFSGRNDTMTEPLLSDFYVLDVSTSTWKVMPTDGIPPARWRASAVFDVPTKTGFMFGGWRDFGGQEAFNDTWQYDAESVSWSPARIAGTGVATAFDSFGAPVASISSNLITTFADPNNFVTMDPIEAISRIEFTGGVIDSFSFGDRRQAIPAISTCGAGTLAFVLAMGGMFLVARRTNLRR